MPDIIIAVTAFLFMLFFLGALKTEDAEWFIVYGLLAASSFTFLFMFTVVP